MDIVNNRAVISGLIYGRVRKLTKYYDRTDMFLIQLLTSRKSGVDDKAVVMFSMRDVFGMEGLSENEIISQLESGTRVCVTGKIQVMRNIIDNQNDIYILADSMFPGDQRANNIKVKGILYSAPDLRKTPKGRQIANFIVSVPSEFDGARESKVPVIAWYDNAQKASDIEVGEWIELEGRLQSRSYIKKYPDGVEVQKNITELSAFRIEKI